MATFTRNEVIAAMHQDRGKAFLLLADHVEKHQYTAEEIIELLRETGEEAQAQAMVVSLRDELKFT